MKTFYNTTSSQRGNVLFLILIAVALFAALSYAVTQSSRSGGDASRETNLLNSAQITQYPTSLQTAALRMIIDGNSVSNILYTPPGDFGTASNQYLFHPNGGGAIYSTVPAELMAGSSEGIWVINGEFAIENIGTAQSDVIAFLPGISQDLCTKINDELGITGIPEFGSDVSASGAGGYYGSYADADSRTAATAISSLPDSLVNFTATELEGQPFGCFENDSGTGTYVYYHAIVER